ncbi:MAG: hypothetical protein C0404_08145 [Verrucomicrobia bacterium]|nr:hypothetical protein [Verrucomicrobiota bacterium]
MQSGKIRVLFCNCSNSDIIADATKTKVLAALAGRGVEVMVLADLCRAVARRDARLEKLRGFKDLRIVACYPRAVKWLLHAAGIELDESVQLFNMRTQEAEGIVAALFRDIDTAGSSDVAVPQDADAWTPWFPAIDYSRCKNCKQCMNFCLFGVYTLSPEQVVQVTNPANCKNLCPACARICPEAAIIFPKLDESPINGAEIDDESVVKAKIKLNVKEMLGDDVYSALAERRKKAKARLLKPDFEKAMQERERCKKKP